MAKIYNVLVPPEAEKQIKGLDPAVFQIIQNAVRKLKDSPQLGKPLTGSLGGLRSWKVSRYRIVYRLLEEKGAIVIAGAGIRKEGGKGDSYNFLQRLKEKGVLEDLMRYVGESS